MATKDGGPAFPVTMVEDIHTIYGIQAKATQHQGMSLRDWFAGQALVALLSLGYGDAEERAEAAYAQADLMLAQREK